jgi:hypothetical protein
MSVSVCRQDLQFRAILVFLKGSRKSAVHIQPTGKTMQNPLLVSFVFNKTLLQVH